jgi:GDP-D-mannose 3',5'-epimerase
MEKKIVVVLGAGGFIGSHLVRRLKSEGHHVVGVDLKYPDFSQTLADEFYIGDLTNLEFVSQVIPDECDELYQLAADMGGAGYIFTGFHDADVVYNSSQINLNVAKMAITKKVKSLFYSSSACIYPDYNQQNPDEPKCSEDSAYPASPDSEYGWEKLFSERMYLSFKRNYGLNVKIARFHNIYGEASVYDNGKEKAPAALCRKIAESADNGEIEIWGDGQQSRSFLYIEDCIDAILNLMRSKFSGPYNIGSEELITINQFAQLISSIATKKITLKHVSGPQGVRGRSSDNKLIKNDLNWEPKYTLKQGISKLYSWIESQINSK